MAVFFSGARYRSIEYTIRPSFPMYDGNGQRRGNTKRLVAKFKEHTFDSDRAAATYGWTPEEKAEVEDYLRNVPEYGIHIYDDTVSTVRPDRGQVDFDYCMFTEMVEGEAVVCGRQVIEGTEFCRKHQEFATAVTEPEGQKHIRARVSTTS